MHQTSRHRAGGAPPRPRLWRRVALAALWLAASMAASAAAATAPGAAFVMDARTGEVLLAENADIRRHPASLTKMMTLYIAFEAAGRGEIDLGATVVVSARAAAEPGSRLGLDAGQSISLRHLVRAVAVKSANDAATALAEAIGGDEAGFVARMNRTAAAMGLTETTFRNAHGLTEAGHLSTARDMSRLGRRLRFDFPDEWALFSRIEADAGVRRVAHTNRRFLSGYAGADGIKTGYTDAAGFNLTASAVRGERWVIATVLGAASSAARAAQVARLMDAAFARIPARVAAVPPAPLAPAAGLLAGGLPTGGLLTGRARPLALALTSPPAPDGPPGAVSVGSLAPAATGGAAPAPPPASPWAPPPAPSLAPPPSPARPEAGAPGNASVGRVPVGVPAATSGGVTLTGLSPAGGSPLPGI